MKLWLMIFGCLLGAFGGLYAFCLAVSRLWAYNETYGAILVIVAVLAVTATYAWCVFTELKGYYTS